MYICNFRLYSYHSRNICAQKYFYIFQILIDLLSLFAVFCDPRQMLYFSIIPPSL